MGRLMVPLSRTPPSPSLGTQKKFDEKQAREGRHRNFKISEMISLLIVAAVMQLQYFRSCAKPYTINLIKRLNLTREHPEERKCNQSHDIEHACQILEVSTMKSEHYIKETTSLIQLKLFPFIIDDVYSLVKVVHHVCRSSVGVLQLGSTILSVCSGLR